MSSCLGSIYCDVQRRAYHRWKERARGVDFDLTPEQQRLRNKCRELAADFAALSAEHNRDASHPVENYERLREEGFLALTVSKEWGGSGELSRSHGRLRSARPGL